MDTRPIDPLCKIPARGALIHRPWCGAARKRDELHATEERWLELEGVKVFFSEWNSSALVKSATSKGKKRELLTPTTFSLIHATDFADRYERQLVPLLRGVLHLVRDAVEHGSLAVEQRRRVEAAMAAGRLRAVVCTATVGGGSGSSVSWTPSCTLDFDAPHTWRVRATYPPQGAFGPWSSTASFRSPAGGCRATPSSERRSPLRGRARPAPAGERAASRPAGTRWRRPIMT